MTFTQRFGIRLRQLRLSRGLSQEQLAEKMDVSTETISNLERGIHAPTFLRLQRIAEGLGIAVPDLFREMPQSE